MSAKGMLVAMVAGTALVMLVGARHSAPERPVPSPARSPETPWLSREAAAQLVGPGILPGPLFAEMTLGGPAPSQAARDRVAKFARDNRVAIDLEVVDDELTAIRIDVSFSGGVGYEGADVFALRLRRPSTGGCCVCGPDTWVNDWLLATEDGIHMRARVRVNRVTVRWERAATLPALVERAEGLLGRSADVVREVAGDRWRELEPGRRYVIEVPYRSRGTFFGYAIQIANHDAYGIQAVVEHGRIAEVTLALGDLDEEASKLLRATLRSRFGRPRSTRAKVWTWRTADRAVTAEVSDVLPTVTIRERS